MNIPGIEIANLGLVHQEEPKEFPGDSDGGPKVNILPANEHHPISLPELGKKKQGLFPS